MTTFAEWPEPTARDEAEADARYWSDRYENDDRDYDDEAA